MVLIVFLIMALFYANNSFCANYLHENNSLECSYKRLKGHLSAVYLLPLIFVESTGKILSFSFLYLY